MRPDLLALLLLAAAPAAAEGLAGRTVLMRAEAWDDPAAPFLRSSDYVAEVGEGPEFGFLPEAEGGLVVVPVAIDLADDRVDLVYGQALPGTFAPAAFNGYVLAFPVECTLLAGARIDPAATTLPLAKDAVKVGPRSLRIDVAGLAHGPKDRIGLLLDVADCPLS